jgi:hypothetical protein
LLKIQLNKPVFGGQFDTAKGERNRKNSLGRQIRFLTSADICTGYKILPYLTTSKSGLIAVNKHKETTSI